MDSYPTGSHCPGSAYAFGKGREMALMDLVCESP